MMISQVGSALASRVDSASDTSPLRKFSVSNCVSFSRVESPFENAPLKNRCFSFGRFSNAERSAVWMHPTSSDSSFVNLVKPRKVGDVSPSQPQLF